MENNFYLIAGNMRGCRVYLCNCEHAEHHTLCVTASEISAKWYKEPKGYTPELESLRLRWPETLWFPMLVNPSVVQRCIKHAH